MLLGAERSQDFSELEDRRQVQRSKIEPIGERWEGAIAIFFFLDAIAVFRLDIAVGIRLGFWLDGLILVVGIGIELVGIGSDATYCLGSGNSSFPAF